MGTSGLIPLPIGLEPSTPESTEKVRVKESPAFDNEVDGNPGTALSVPSSSYAIVVSALAVSAVKPVASPKSARIAISFRISVLTTAPRLQAKQVVLEHPKYQKGTLKTKGLQQKSVTNRKPFSLALGSFAEIFASSPRFAANKTVRPAAF